MQKDQYTCIRKRKVWEGTLGYKGPLPKGDQNLGIKTLLLILIIHYNKLKHKNQCISDIIGIYYI